MRRSFLCTPLLFLACGYPEVGQTNQFRFQLFLNPGIEVDSHDLMAIECVRTAWGAHDAAVYLVDEAHWTLGDHVGWTHRLPRRGTRVYIRWERLVSTYNRMWILNHEFAHWATSNSHSNPDIWYVKGGEDSLEWHNWTVCKELSHG